MWGSFVTSSAPDDVTIGSTGGVFPLDVQRFAVILATTIAVGAFLIKIALMIHIQKIERENDLYVSQSEDLNDCLPECIGVSVACKYLTLQVAVMNRIIPEKDPFLDGDDLSAKDNVSRRVSDANGSALNGGDIEAARGAMRSARKSVSSKSPSGRRMSHFQQLQSFGTSISGSTTVETKV